MYDFSEEMMATLAAAGWFPGRRVDVSEWHKAVLEEGFEVSPLALELWATFGGLILESPTFKLNKAFPPPVLVDPLETLGSRCAKREGLAGEVLTPFGECKEQTAIFVTPTGAFYGDYEGTFFCHGAKMPESMEIAVLNPGMAKVLIKNYG
ncbi:MAG: SUKH-3 domain-containing protein [Gemmataceae bacterium]